MQKLLIFCFSKNISVYAIVNNHSFNDTLINDIVSFEQVGPGVCLPPFSHLKPFIPEFLKWILPSLNLDFSTDANVRFSVLNDNKIRMANSVHPDETARYKLSHLDLHCLHRCLFWFFGRKGLSRAP